MPTFSSALRQVLSIDLRNRIPLIAKYVRVMLSNLLTCIVNAATADNGNGIAFLALA